MRGAGHNTIFRQAALDRLSSPEQLDRLMTVAGPGDWISLAALAVLAIGAVAWSLWGTVASRVSGSGILVGQGGSIYTPVAQGSGTVTALTVAPGEFVAAGQPLARIAQPDLVDELASQRATVAEYQAQLGALARQVASYAGARASNNQVQRRLLEEEQRDAGIKAAAIAKQVQAAETLLARGIVTQARVDELRQQLAAAQQGVSEAGGRIVRLNADEIGARNGAERDILTYQSRLGEARRRLAETAADLDRKQWVKSPIAGRVLEVKAPVGSHADIGTPVVAIENGSSRLQLVLYVPPADGKLVKPGMLVHIAPSVARREEVGTMIGRVTAVSAFPATQQAMLATLQNAKLVDQFSTGGAPIAATVMLATDRRTATGYRWAGGRGPPLPLTSGTLAEAEVTVDRQPPISFVLPMIRGAAGL